MRIRERKNLPKLPCSPPEIPNDINSKNIQFFFNLNGRYVSYLPVEDWGGGLATNRVGLWGSKHQSIKSKPP